MPRRLCLVTGASAGIGEAFARVFAERGYDLALTARRSDRLETLAADLKARHGAHSVIIQADLEDRAAPEAIVAAITAQGRTVDALVNNAGYGLPGTYATTRWEDQAAFLQVLLTAPSELAHRVLPGMVERRFGRILNIASLAGLIPGSKGHTLYGPVKSYMVKFSQSLNAETEGTGVNVTAVCPGFTFSEFHDVTGTREEVSKMPKWLWKTARDVAEDGFAAAERNQAVAVTGGANKAIAVLAKLLPDPAAQALMASQSSRFRRLD